MKKIVSLILAVALIAAFAVSASAATIVVHEQNAWETQNQIEHGDMIDMSFCAWLNQQATPFIDGVDVNAGFCTLAGAVYANGTDYAQRNVAACSQMVKISNAPEDMALTWTTCAQAMTIAEGKAICAISEDDAIENLTVFYQRNVTTCGGDMDIRLWPCNPERNANQSVVVVYRPVDGEWTILGVQSESKDITVTLPAGEGAFAVCLAW